MIVSFPDRGATSASFALVVGSKQMEVKGVEDGFEIGSAHPPGKVHVIASEPTSGRESRHYVELRLFIEAGQADSEIIRID